MLFVTPILQLLLCIYMWLWSSIVVTNSNQINLFKNIAASDSFSFNLANHSSSVVTLQMLRHFQTISICFIRRGEMVYNPHGLPWVTNRETFNFGLLNLFIELFLFWKDSLLQRKKESRKTLLIKVHLYHKSKLTLITTVASRTTIIFQKCHLAVDLELL